MKKLTQFKFFLWYFGHFKVPLIGYLKPALIRLDDKHAVVKLPLHRRSKNHLHSMYLGALTVGADIACGLHGFYHADKAGVKISLAFKSLQAQFIKRPETDVYFVSNEGDTVQQMINDAIKTQMRMNHPIRITAYTHYLENPVEIAYFTLELSLKVL